MCFEEWWGQMDNKEMQLQGVRHEIPKLTCSVHSVRTSVPQYVVAQILRSV